MCFLGDSCSFLDIGKTVSSDLLECLVAWFAVSKDSPAMTGIDLWSRLLELQRSMKLAQGSGFMAEAVGILVLRDFISFQNVF